MLVAILSILLSIGAINALIPLLIIIALIAAAAGLTRGFSLFNVFGIASLMRSAPTGGTSKGSLSKGSFGFRHYLDPNIKLTQLKPGEKLMGKINSSVAAKKTGAERFDALTGLPPQRQPPQQQRSPLTRRQQWNRTQSPPFGWWSLASIPAYTLSKTVADNLTGFNTLARNYRYVGSNRPQPGIPRTPRQTERLNMEEEREQIRGVLTRGISPEVNVFRTFRSGLRGGPVPLLIDLNTGWIILMDPNTGRRLFIDPTTGNPTTNQNAGQLRLMNPNTGATILRNTTAVRSSPLLTDPNTGRRVLTDPDNGKPILIDPSTGGRVLTDSNGKPVLVNPNTGMPTKNERTGKAILIDPNTGRTLVDPSTGGRVFVDPNAGKALFIDPSTGGRVFVDPASVKPAPLIKQLTPLGSLSTVKPFWQSGSWQSMGGLEAPKRAEEFLRQGRLAHREAHIDRHLRAIETLDRRATAGTITRKQYVNEFSKHYLAVEDSKRTRLAQGLYKYPTGGTTYHILTANPDYYRYLINGNNTRPHI